MSQAPSSQYPQPQPPSIHCANFKTYPSDFIVRELMQIVMTGAGEHLWLHIKKINLNTLFVVKLLAMWADIPMRDVGFSGLKDRHAETYQWFSLRIPNGQMPAVDFATFINSQALPSHETLEVTDHVWHNKKLNRGTHKFNHFTVILRDVVGDSNAINQQLQDLPKIGIANYFGKQRFGHGGNNINAAETLFKKILASPKPYKPKRHELEQHNLLISAAKSLIFNEILSKRIQAGTWNTAIDGEIFNLDGTGSIFQSEIDDTILTRLHDGDIHPTAILYGVGSRSTGEVLTIERDVLALPAMQTLTEGLNKIGTKASYRPLRLLPKNLTWQWLDDDSTNKPALQLDFTLPSGTFATSVLSAIAAELNEPSHQK
ncbi:MAG: tRNA pseudouridine(13) synthase TruD [Moraxella sp.]|nr:tRNA pseudouridine(13) synthase TruD [Moraxella sp.]